MGYFMNFMVWYDMICDNDMIYEVQYNIKKVILQYSIL